MDEEKYDIMIWVISAMIEKNGGILIVSKEDVMAAYNKPWTYMVKDGQMMFAHTTEEGS